MMTIKSTVENPRNESTFRIPITTSTCPTWKLYENPYFNSPSHKQKQQHQQEEEDEDKHHPPRKQIHRIHLPISARKIAASFWDLTFIKLPFMESELDVARAQIAELKAELASERKARKNLESTSKRLAKELSEEKRGREEVERLCEELAKEITSDKAEINRVKRQMEEERKMLRVAEVLREERVQMKLAEAKFLLEDKLLELEAFQQMRTSHGPSSSSSNSTTQTMKNQKDSNGQAQPIITNTSTCGYNYQQKIQPRAAASLGTENPHIKRGIKGFVEFPKVVRTIGSKSRHLGTKLECQKSQLMILLKQKTLIRPNNLIMS